MGILKEKKQSRKKNTEEAKKKELEEFAKLPKKDKQAHAVFQVHLKRFVDFPSEAFEGGYDCAKHSHEMFEFSVDELNTIHKCLINLSAGFGKFVEELETGKSDELQSI